MDEIINNQPITGKVPENKPEIKEDTVVLSAVQQESNPSSAVSSRVFQIHVRFRDRCKLFNCFSYDGSIKEEANCVVDSDDGPQFGQVVNQPKLIPDGKIEGLMKILRVALPDDIKHYYENIQKEKDAYKSCQQKIEEKALEMKLVEADYSLDRSKIVFYFTAEKRMDFRELVKDLAYLLKARIEMRQIGVRDEAKMLGGYGCCGRELCCVSFLKDFVPVTIKMAKEQQLPLNQTKISGMCGRLMCCLAYEQGQYDSVKEAALANINKLQETKDVKSSESQIKAAVETPGVNNSSRQWQNNRKQPNNNNQNGHNKDKHQSNQNNQAQKSWYNSYQNRQNNAVNKPGSVIEPPKTTGMVHSAPPEGTGEKK
ncbi:MAG: regulatory iron-sulfur-containing complex subunit RicT [Candidatus Firestonebacteria bacterium]